MFDLYRRNFFPAKKRSISKKGKRLGNFSSVRNEARILAGVRFGEVNRLACFIKMKGFGAKATNLTGGH